MKKSSRVSGFVAIVAMAALTAAPLLAATGGGMTTADLALQLARVAGITPTPAYSPQAALKSLERAGIGLGNDLNAPVTEQALAQVGAALGVKVTTSRPDAPVTPAMVGAFVASFEGRIRGAIDPVSASCQGRKSRAGREGIPASPSDPNSTAEPCEEP